MLRCHGLFYYLNLGEAMINYTEYLAWDKEGDKLLEVDSLHPPFNSKSGKDVVVITDDGLEWRAFGEILLLEIVDTDKFNGEK